MAIRRIGFVGLGNMGWPMAENLVRAGFELSVYDVRTDRAAEFATAHSATVSPSAAALANCVECIITMLPDHFVVREVVLGGGRECLAAGLEAGTRRLGAELASRDIALVDAGMTRGVAGAKQGSLAFFLGGTQRDIERAMPVLQALGDTFVHLGPLGHGHSAKLISNV